jgi:hypothetical protein
VTIISSTKKRKMFGLQAKNVFGGDSSSDDETAPAVASKNPINRELLHEQAALRQRAAAAVYDFDGTYEAPTTSTATTQKDDKKQPRYITDLLEQAKRRKFERDIVMDRKAIREQDQDEANHAGKEKFITSAYKKTLAEREAWAQKDKEEQDVTKQSSLGGFYANLSRNVAMGAVAEKQEPAKDETVPSLGFTDGFDQAEMDPPTVDSNEINYAANAGHPLSTAPELLPTKSIQQIRQEKIAKARTRYFQRRGITPEEAAQEQLQ